MIHSSGKDGDFYPIDYRIYSPDSDGKTKNDHFQEMFLRTIADKSLKARTILFDSWYCSVDNLTLIHRNGWTFFTTLKSNRMVSISREQGYIHLDTIEWSEKMLQIGIMVKLKEIPFLVKLFNGAARRIVSPDGHIDWVITNSPDYNLWADDVKKEQNSEYIYREMATMPDGSFVRSPLEGAPNAKQMGVRTPESIVVGGVSDIKPVDGMVGPTLTGLQGLSASNPPRLMQYKNTTMGVVNTNNLPKGLSSVIDNPKNPSHRSIYPSSTMPLSTFQSLLNSIPWMPVTPPKE